MAITFNRRGLVATRAAVFRVDAGPGVGMGHFMRCRTLAFEMIRRDWVVFFVGRGLPAELLSSARAGVNAVINLIDFPYYPDSSDDVMEFFNILSGRFIWNLDCIIVDTYRYNRDDFAYMQRFNSQSVPVIVIDDLANRDTPAQAVINPNPLFDPLPYQRQKIPVVLCGEQYTLIRPEIMALTGRSYREDGPVIVTLGGGDVVEHLMKVLEAIPEDISNRVCVSASDNCPHQEIEAWVSRHPTQRYCNFDSRLFPDLLASASLAITAGGTTLWEVYTLGIPSLCLLWVDNQQQTSVVIREQATSFLIDIVSQINIELQSKWLENGLQTFVKSAGPAQTQSVQQRGFCADEVISRVKTSLGIGDSTLIDGDFNRKTLARLHTEPEFWQQMRDRQQRLIDGRGALRCVDALETLQWHTVPLFDADWRRNNENW